MHIQIFIANTYHNAIHIQSNLYSGGINGKHRKYSATSLQQPLMG